MYLLSCNYLLLSSNEIKIKYLVILLHLLILLHLISIIPVKYADVTGPYALTAAAWVQESVL